ncbi:MAG TPA: histidine kinase [Pseudacidobacterium sp.]|jgi:signal transduction histidine kinase|nr:histidine kinase [Pseudacidobacterium sp.]
MKHIRLYIFLYFTALAFLEVFYHSLDRLARGYSGDWGVVSIEQVTGTFGVLVLLPLILWSARRFPLRFSFRRILWHLMAVVVFSVLHTLWNWGMRSLIFLALGMGHYNYGIMRIRFFMEFPIDVILYSICVGTYMVYQNWMRTRDVEQQLASARLENLSRQLQPHFLFNALNAVSSVMYEDIGRADKMLALISDFLRSTLRLPESPLIAVSDELNFVRRYLDVMQTRLEAQLQFVITCDPKVEAVRVPALLLQPLVENAVEHGKDPYSGKLDINIAIRKVNKHIQITIRDHGSGPERSNGGHGLANTRQRLATAYRGEASFRLEHHPQGGAVAEIQIPA